MTNSTVQLKKISLEFLQRLSTPRLLLTCDCHFVGTTRTSVYWQNVANDF